MLRRPLVTSCSERPSLTWVVFPGSCSAVPVAFAAPRLPARHPRYTTHIPHELPYGTLSASASAGRPGGIVQASDPVLYFLSPKCRGRGGGADPFVPGRISGREQLFWRAPRPPPPPLLSSWVTSWRGQRPRPAPAPGASRRVPQGSLRGAGRSRGAGRGRGTGSAAARAPQEPAPTAPSRPVAPARGRGEEREPPPAAMCPRQPVECAPPGPGPQSTATHGAR